MHASLSAALSIPAMNTTRPNASAMHKFRWIKRWLVFFSLVLTEQYHIKQIHYSANSLTYESQYSELWYVDRQRQTKDILQPMYEITDKALSSFDVDD